MSANGSWMRDAAALIPKAWELAKVTSKAVGDRASYDFRIAHEHYCVAVVQKYCRARTFFIRDEPKFLEDFYVPASIIRAEKDRVPRAGLQDLASVARRTIVMGSGGSGKTIFMRHLLLDAIQKGDRYPVFIELRQLNEMADVILEDLVVEFMHEHGFPLGREFALQSLHDGLLVVLLDGFDEVVASKRNHLEKEIRRLGTKSASQIVVSSRQDSLLDGWDHFSTVAIAPLELDEACELIQKIPFKGEEEIKTRFVERLKGGVFQSHEYFLSNPLLLSVMLLTYGDSADIPSKFSSFYEQAYSALYQKHDALKSGYRRGRKVQLDILDFGRLFGAFSAITYDKRAFRFSLSEGAAYVEAAKRLMDLPQVSSTEFLEDARQAVCLLVEDGLDYAYVHRSFQEYFVARYIAEASQGMKTRFLNKLIAATDDGMQGENVLQLLHEMNPALVEDHYLIPEIKNFFGTFHKRKISKASWRVLFSKVFTNVRVIPPQSINYGIKSRRHLAALLFLKKNCCEKHVLKVRRPRKERYEEFGNYLGANQKVLSLRSVAARSPVWDLIDEDSLALSIDGLERLRLAALEVERRSKDRSAALADIFEL